MEAQNVEYLAKKASQQAVASAAFLSTRGGSTVSVEDFFSSQEHEDGIYKLDEQIQS